MKQTLQRCTHAKTNFPKTFVVLMIVIFTSLTSDVLAQFSSGEKFLGGSVGLSLTATKSEETSQLYADNEYSQFSFSPTIGFFINEKWAVGGGLGYESSMQKLQYQTNFSKYRTYSFSIDVLTRRYFEITDKFYFTVEGNLGFNRGANVSSNDTGEGKSKFYGIGITARPLLVFFPTPNWSVEGGIGTLHYGYSKNISSDNYTSSLVLNYGSLNLGIAYYFRKAE